MAKYLALCAFGAVAATGSSALATPINYGNFGLGGSTVDFLQVTEDSTTDPTPLFGAPTAALDAIIFNPVSFGASATNGAFDITDGTLTTMVDARPGFNIPSVNIAEAGDYTLAGPGSPGTWCSVSMAVFITVYEVNDAAINSFTYSASGTFSPNGGFYSLPANAGILQIWNGSLTVNVDALVASHGFSGSATRIQITLDNQLLAFSEPNTVSFIKKKEAGVIITVPAPASLGVVGLAGLAAFRRRR